MRRWRELGPVVAVTLAPERPGALALVAALAARRRAGVARALRRHRGRRRTPRSTLGARSVTHLFNAMSPLRQRAPGLPGAALGRRDVTVQVVVDGHHLADDVVRLVFAAATGRVVLVTDATCAAGRGDGPATLAGMPVRGASTGRCATPAATWPAAR